MSRKLVLRALLLANAATLGASGVGSPVVAKARNTVDFDLPAQSLDLTLKAIARASGEEILYAADAVAGLQAPPIRGQLTTEGAIDAALSASPLVADHRAGAIVVHQRPAPASKTVAEADEPSSAGQENIVVTGSHLRGAPVASPVIRLDRESIRDRGQASLAEAVRAIPQNFGGGQNPGVGNNVPATSGVNVGGATSVNLRGLGSDATLTLVNGHRLSYSASRQAIDISSIPLGAVDRIEIVPDGASALYGSDAVAGVVNVLLRRDFQGFETSVRVGGATDGGDFEQRYGAVAGTGWRSGGVVGVYEFSRTTAIRGRDRSYTAARSPALTLFPSFKGHSATISAHQELTPRLSVEVDGLFNQRRTNSSYALNAAGDIALSGASLTYDSRSFVVAPSLRYRAGGDWRLFATGSTAQDRTRYDVKSFSQGQVFDFPGNCYCNRAASFELGGDGTLIDGPAGPIKLAAGAGWQTNRLLRFNGVGASTNVTKTQDAYFAYGELGVPVIAPYQHVSWAERLSLSAAGRFEHYPGIGGVVTPKLGLIYAPNADLSLSGTWGKSFRAPTLYQQYQSSNVVVARPSAFGGTGFPAGSTGLLVQGGNPDLKPERATSWSVTAQVHPAVIDGFHVNLTYFNTRYRDRVVTPIIFLNQSLSDPVNSGRLIFNPSASLIASTIASATSFANVSGAPFDPANVRVLVDDRNVNAGLQKIHGWDLEARYNKSLGGDLGDLSARLNATFLHSSQQLTKTQPAVQLAGILFNPPHVFLRGDLGWNRGPLTLNAGITRIGGVEDRRSIPARKIHGMTIADLTVRLQSPASDGPLGGLDASFTVQNLFNRKPAAIATSLPSEAPYDSTNYSPVGRFVAMSLTKKW